MVFLVENRPVGVQLGLGVQSAAIYSGAKNSETAWVKNVDEQLSKCVSKVDVLFASESVGKSLVFEDLNEPDDEFVVDSDSDGEDEGMMGDLMSNLSEEDYKYWKELLISKMHWGNLSPHIPDKLEVFTKVDFGSELNNEYNSNLPALIVGNDYMPQELAGQFSGGDIRLQAEDKVVKRNQIRISDPVTNNLLAVGHIQTASNLRNGEDGDNLLVSASGKANSILNLSLLAVNPLKFQDTREQNSTIGNIILNSWAYNKNSKVYSIDLKFSIKKILFPQVSSVFGRSSDLIGVLTDSALHIIKIVNASSKTGELKYTLYNPFHFDNLGDFPFSDFAFNPWDFSELAVIDTKGNWALCRLPKIYKGSNDLIISPTVKGSIFDPEELSNWKKISWSSKYCRILLFSRSNFVELDYEEDWQVKIAEAKTWSSFRDYKRVNDNIGVLLTSKEIILLNIKTRNGNVSRLMSWKHDLNSNDTTLKLAVELSNYGWTQVLFSYIYSKKFNKIYMHGFSCSNENSLIQSTKQSRIIKLDKVLKGVECLESVDITNLEGNSQYFDETQNEGVGSIGKTLFVRDSQNGNLTQFIIGNFSNIKQVEQKHVRFMLDDDDISPQPEKLSEIFLDYFVEQVTERVDRSILENEQIQDTHNILQIFGSELSTSLVEFLRSLDNQSTNERQATFLFKIFAQTPRKITDFSEFHDFWEQFMNHFEQTSAIEIPPLKIALSLLLSEKVNDADIFYNKLLQCWEILKQGSNSVVLEVVNNLLWSNLRFTDISTMKTYEEERKQKLKEPYKKIIDMWDMDDNQIEAEQDKLNSSTFSSQPQFSLGTQSQIPTIRSSQPSRKHARGIPSLSGRSQKIIKKKSAFTKLPASSQASQLPSSLPPTLPDHMIPAFSLMHSQVPPLSQLQSQSSQPRKKKKKKVGGFG